MSGVERADLARDQDWRLSANCVSVDPDLMFPDKNQIAQANLARRICANCIVQAECLEDAIADPPDFGIRAGKGARELQRLHKEQYGGKADEMRQKYEQARAMRAEGKTLEEIAEALGYAGHGGVRFLLAHSFDEATS